MDKDLQIQTKGKHPDELECAQIVQLLVQEYDVPLFTNKVLIEKGALPYSHPILTLNTRNKEPLLMLQKLVHEQLHWFAKEHSNFDNAIRYLKEHYKDNGEHNVTEKDPDSFWEHLIVCFNTRNTLKKLVSDEELHYIYREWQAYPLTEKLIADKFEHIKDELNRFQIVYEGN